MKREVLIVNVTQCLEGTVDDSIYAAGEVCIIILCMTINYMVEIKMVMVSHNHFKQIPH